MSGDKALRKKDGVAACEAAAGGPASQPRNTTSLLETLAGKAGCEYLSDLRCMARYRKLLCRALKELPAGAYPLLEWNDTVSYLLQSSPGFSSPEEAKRFLQQALDAVPARTKA